MTKQILTALTLIVLTTTANASSGQWAREVSKGVARAARLVESDGVPVYAHICGKLDMNYLMSEERTGEIFTLRLNDMSSTESGDKNGIAKVRLVNIADCKSRLVKISVVNF